MKKIICIAMALVFLYCLPAAAASELPSSTRSMQISMLWHKWTRQMPDFDLWSAANRANRNVYAETFSLLSPREQITVVISVTLGKPEGTSEGLIIQGMDDSIFFDYEYQGRHFAVIPGGIGKAPWLKIAPRAAQDILANTENGTNARLALRLAPVAADKIPLRLNNKDYNLLMTEITGLEIWSAEEKLLWQPPTDQNGVLNLYQ